MVYNNMRCFIREKNKAFSETGFGGYWRMVFPPQSTYVRKS